MNAIEYIDQCKTPEDAEQCLQFLVEQDGHIAGRILPANPRAWSEYERLPRVQVFYSADGIAKDSWLPDGCRFVFLSPSFLRGLQ